MGGNERMVEGSKREWEGMNGCWKDLIRMGGELEDCGRIKRKREGTKEWWEDL